MLQTFKEINNLAHQITGDEIERANRQINDTTTRNQEFSKALNEATTQYVLTGIGRIPSDGRRWNGWVRWGHRSCFHWDDYFQKLAKDLKRPYVYVPDTSMVILSRRKYTDVLVGSFLLTAVETHSRWDFTRAPVTYRKTSDKWYFHFIGETQALVEHWLKECATNPEYRRALRLEK